MPDAAHRARRVLRVAALLLVTAASTHPAAALANGASVWEDCGDDAAVNQTHSQSEYTQALKNPPADAAEYTNCLDLIRQAQIKASHDAGGGGGTPNGGTGSDSPGGSSVAPAALSHALQSSGIDPSQTQDHAAAAAAPAPAPVTVDGQRIDLEAGRVPSVAGALSLPLPLAASAIVVLLSAGLPLVRLGAARLSRSQDGVTSGS
jgi:hypothetical protein